MTRSEGTHAPHVIPYNVRAEIESVRQYRGRAMINALTIDVEDYHSVSARDWKGEVMAPTAKVVRNTRQILDWLAPRGVHGTFFVLGDVAETYPELIRDIHAAGHEIGVHGFYHRQVFKLTPDEFRIEVSSAKRIIEDLIGQPVYGHRAPAFSIMPHTSWALDVLVREGFRYDSSIFPIAGRRYGWPGFRPDIHEIKLAEGRSIIEAPLSTVRMMGRRWPACGGGYIRHFPAWVSRWAFSRVQRERPAILYTHPYEIELDAGEADTSGLDPKAAARVRKLHWLQMRNRASVEAKIVGLISQFEFSPLGRVIEQALDVSLN